MSIDAKKIVLHSESGYSVKYEPVLSEIIRSRALLFCVVGKDCELWHDIMDEMLVGDGSLHLGFEMITTWHNDESLEEVIEFARIFYVDTPDPEAVQIIVV